MSRPKKTKLCNFNLRLKDVEFINKMSAKLGLNKTEIIELALTALKERGLTDIDKLISKAYISRLEP